MPEDNKKPDENISKSGATNPSISQEDIDKILKGFARAILLQIPAQSGDNNYTLPEAKSSLLRLITEARIEELEAINAIKDDHYAMEKLSYRLTELQSQLKNKEGE